MGMDVCGKAPRSQQGEYFRNNIWWWHPLADFCLQLAPEVCAPCRYWHSNDGDGLDNDGAIALSLSLQAAVNTNAAMMHQRKVERGDSEGPFSVENVISFIAFLRDCGGFSIC
jgi:hypothetical protein